MVIRCLQVLHSLVANGVTAHIQISCIMVHQDVVWHCVEWVDLKNTTVYNHVRVQSLCALCLVNRMLSGKCTQMLMLVRHLGTVQTPQESLCRKLTDQKKSLPTQGNWMCISSKSDPMHDHITFIPTPDVIVTKEIVTCCKVSVLSLFLLNTRISRPRQGAT